MEGRRIVELASRTLAPLAARSLLFRRSRPPGAGAAAPGAKFYRLRVGAAPGTAARGGGNLTDFGLVQKRWKTSLAGRSLQMAR